MKKVSEEMLMAYADGELDRDTAAEVARAAASDPELRVRVARLHETRTLTREAYGDVIDEPVPERLIAAASAGRRKRAGVGWRNVWLPLGAAAFASVAGFLVAAVWLPGDAGVPDLGGFDGLAEIVARLPSGASATVPLAGGAVTLAPTGTYATPDGYCRSFAVKPQSTAAAPWRGVECLHGDRWTVDMAIRDPGAGGDVFAPASAAATQALDAFLDAAGAGGAVGPAHEQELIDRHWREAESG
jgi:hypothetical protein